MFSSQSTTGRVDLTEVAIEPRKADDCARVSCAYDVRLLLTRPRDVVYIRVFKTTTKERSRSTLTLPVRARKRGHVFSCIFSAHSGFTGMRTFIIVVVEFSTLST